MWLRYIEELDKYSFLILFISQIDHRHDGQTDSKWFNRQMEDRQIDRQIDSHDGRQMDRTKLK